MRSFAPLRLAAQLCIYAALLCLFAPFRADWPLFALLPALALAAGLAAFHCGSAGIRLLLGLVPALALLLASGWLSLAAGVLAVVYIAAVLSSGRFSLELWQYRPETITLIVLSAVLSLLSTLAAFRSPPTRGFAVSCILLALLALRALRMRRSGSAAWEAANPGLLLLPLAGGAVLGAALWASVPLFQHLVSGLGALLGGLVSLWNSFWGWLLHYADSIGEDLYVEETAVPTEWFGEVTPPTLPDHSGKPLNLAELSIPWGTLLAVFGGLVLLLLAIRLLRKSKKAAPTPKQADYVFEPVPTAPKRSREHRRRRRRAEDTTNNALLRAVYRDYLNYLRMKGVSRRLSDTTEEITDAARALLVETDELLRSLYRKARYSSEEISDEDLRTAEDQLQRLLAEENLQKT